MKELPVQTGPMFGPVTKVTAEIATAYRVFHFAKAHQAIASLAPRLNEYLSLAEEQQYPANLLRCYEAVLRAEMVKTMAEGCQIKIDSLKTAVEAFDVCARAVEELETL